MMAFAGCIAAALAGCAPSAPDLDSGTGKELQSQVLAVSRAAAAEDPAAGLRSLDGLVGRLTAAAANGEVSFKRHHSIMKAVEAVRADLLAAQAAKAAAAKAEAERAAAAKASAAAKEAAAKAAAEASAAQSAVVNQTPAPAPGPAVSTQPAGGGRDSGSNKGKGKGGEDD
jgi:peptidoglycan hydrolase CwlO-like protein